MWRERERERERMCVCGGGGGWGGGGCVCVCIRQASHLSNPKARQLHLVASQIRRDTPGHLQCWRTKYGRHSVYRRPLGWISWLIQRDVKWSNNVLFWFTIPAFVQRKWGKKLTFAVSIDVLSPILKPEPLNHEAFVLTLGYSVHEFGMTRAGTRLSVNKLVLITNLMHNSFIL
jgi:hypothetical protein